MNADGSSTRRERRGLNVSEDKDWAEVAIAATEVGGSGGVISGYREAVTHAC